MQGCATCKWAGQPGRSAGKSKSPVILWTYFASAVDAGHHRFEQGSALKALSQTKTAASWKAQSMQPTSYESLQLRSTAKKPHAPPKSNIHRQKATSTAKKEHAPPKSRPKRHPCIKKCMILLTSTAKQDIHRQKVPPPTGRSGCTLGSSKIRRQLRRDFLKNHGQ